MHWQGKLARAFARLAVALYPWRWLFACITVASSVIGLIAATNVIPAVRWTFAPVSAAFSLSWTIFLTCIWFHPTRGVLNEGAIFARDRLADALSPARASVFLVVFAVVGVGIVPAIVLLRSGLF
jgi:hypothetical protein